MKKSLSWSGVTVKWSWRILRASPKLGFLMILLTALSGLVSAAPAFFFSRLVNDVTRHASSGVVLITVLMMVLSSILAYAVSYISGMAGVTISNRASLKMESTLSNALIERTGVESFDDPTTQATITEAENISLQFPDTATDVIISVTSSTVTLGTYAVILGMSWPWMGFVLILTVVPMVAIQRVANRISREANKNALHQGRWRDYYFEMLRSPGGARELRLLGIGSRLVARVVGHHTAVLDSELKQQQTTSRAQTASSLFNQAILGSGLLVIGFSISDGHGSPGTLVLFFTAVVAIQSQLLTAVMTTERIATLSGFLRSYELVIQKTVEHSGSLKTDGQRCTHEIRFENVSFRYRSDLPLVLEDVSLVIPGNSYVALVGANGSGKSTVVALLLRFYAPTSGRITMDGRDIALMSVDEYRRSFTGVAQGFQEFEMTLRENVALAVHDQDVGSSKPCEYSELLDLEGIARNLSHGWDTVLTRERIDDTQSHGGALSGGEWQRIAWARALSKPDYSVMVIDEGTSMLDPLMEKRLTRYLSESCTGSTRIVVAHRPAQALAADSVIKFGGGRVLDQVSLRGGDSRGPRQVGDWFEESGAIATR